MLAKRKTTPQKHGPVPQRRPQTSKGPSKPRTDPGSTSNTPSAPSHPTVSPSAAAGQSNNITLATNITTSQQVSSTGTTQHVGFLRIPPELRYIIYDYSAQPDDLVTFGPGPAAFKSTNPIFLVTHQTCQEAESNLVSKSLNSVSYYSNFRATVKDLDFRKLNSALKTIGLRSFRHDGTRTLQVKLTMSEIAANVHGIDFDPGQLGKMLGFLETNFVQWTCQIVKPELDVWLEVSKHVEKLLATTERYSRMRERVKYLFDLLQQSRRKVMPEGKQKLHEA